MPSAQSGIAVTAKQPSYNDAEVQAQMRRDMHTALRLFLQLHEEV